VERTAILTTTLAGPVGAESDTAAAARTAADVFRAHAVLARTDRPEERHLRTGQFTSRPPRLAVAHDTAITESLPGQPAGTAGPRPLPRRRAVPLTSSPPGLRDRSPNIALDRQSAKDGGRQLTRGVDVP